MSPTQTIIQVPVSKTLRDEATAAVKKQGFSSLQEAIRIFLQHLADKKLTIYFTPTPQANTSERGKIWQSKV